MMKRRWLRPGLWCLVLVGVATVLPACLREAPSQVQVRAAAWRVPAGFKAQAETQAEAYTKTGWAQEIVHEGTGIALVFVPAGEFDMGSPAGERERGENEGPVHRVKITKPFYMGRYEVTQGQWQKVMDQNPSGMKGSDRLPVEGVSWDESQEFLRKAGHGLRLPTEAEWEYACRAGPQTRFYFGDDADHRQLANHAWYGSNSDAKTHPVGEKQANGWGLHDLYGNVAEWCQDWLGYEGYKDKASDDPTGPATGAYRALRGGGRYSAPRYCRSATRSGGAPDLSGFYFDVGFRVVAGVSPGL